MIWVPELLRATSLRPESEREDVGVVPEIVVLVWVTLLVVDVVTAETLSMADRALDDALVDLLLKVLLIGIVGVKLGEIAGTGGSEEERVVAEAKLRSLVVSAKTSATFKSNNCEDSEDGSLSSGEESSPEARSASRADRLFRGWSPSTAD